MSVPDHLCKSPKMIGGNVKYGSLLMLLLIAVAAEFHTCSAFNVDPYQSGLLGQLKELGKTPAAGPAGRLDLLGQRQNLESQLFIEQDKQKRAGLEKALEDQRKKQAELLRQQPERGKQPETLSGQQEDLRKETERQQLESQKQTDQKRHQQDQVEQTHRQQQQTEQLQKQHGQAEQLRLQQQQGQQMRQQQQHQQQQQAAHEQQQMLAPSQQPN